MVAAYSLQRIQQSRSNAKGQPTGHAATLYVQARSTELLHLLAADIRTVRLGCGAKRVSAERLTGRYLFNPYIILSSLARSTTNIDNALILFALSLACQDGSMATIGAGAVLALAAYTSLYPVLLLPPVLMMVHAKRKDAVWPAALAFGATLTGSLSLGYQHWRVM